MSRRVSDLLRARCGTRSDGWVFPSNRAASGHLRSIDRLFREARRQAGLPKELVLYCARHDYGTRVLMRTGNLAAVMKTMGHRDVKTAMHYQHPELDVVRAALDYGAASAVSHSLPLDLGAIRRDNYRERERPFASRFGLRGTDALGMKTSAGSLNRVLNFRTCSKVRFRCPVMNIETALSEPN